MGNDVTITKNSVVISDPVNQTINPKRIPGAKIRFIITVDNSSSQDITDVKLDEKLLDERFEYILSESIEKIDDKLVLRLDDIKAHSRIETYYDVILR